MMGRHDPKVYEVDLEVATGHTLTVGGFEISAAELAVIDGVTAGTVTASKAVVVDSSKNIGDFNNLDAVNIDAGASGAAGSVDVFPGTAARGKLAIACAAPDWEYSGNAERQCDGAGDAGEYA
jgi:hypothetical protein